MGAKFLTTTTDIAKIELINLARGNKSQLTCGKIQELERIAVLTFRIWAVKPRASSEMKRMNKEREHKIRTPSAKCNKEQRIETRR